MVAQLRLPRDDSVDARDGAQVFVYRVELMIGHVLKRGPGHDLEKFAVQSTGKIWMNLIQIDTSPVATDSIQYVATDQNGLTSTTTRTVIIEAADAPSIVPTAAASTSQTTTFTPQ